MGKNNPEKLKEYAEKRKLKKHEISENQWTECKQYFNNQCAYCGLNINSHWKRYKGELRLIDFHKDHVDDNGTNDLSNCVPSCHTCNSSKYNWEYEYFYNPDNPDYTVERDNKIRKWCLEDYKNIYKTQ